MYDVSRTTRQKSWHAGRRRVSVLAEMAIRKERVSERLKELRENKGFTQEQAAPFVGITLRQWQRWEGGESMPYPRNLDAIASKFGITIAEFFDGPVAETGLAEKMSLLEDHLVELQASVSELRQSVQGLAADSLRHTRELQELRDRDHRTGSSGGGP